MARSQPSAAPSKPRGESPKQGDDGRRRRDAGRRPLIASIVGSVILAGLAMPLLSRIVVARGPISDSPYALLFGGVFKGDESHKHPGRRRGAL